MVFCTKENITYKWNFPTIWHLSQALSMNQLQNHRAIHIYENFHWSVLKTSCLCHLNMVFSFNSNDTLYIWLCSNFGLQWIRSVFLVAWTSPMSQAIKWNLKYFVSRPNANVKFVREFLRPTLNFVNDLKGKFKGHKDRWHYDHPIHCTLSAPLLIVLISQGR